LTMCYYYFSIWLFFHMIFFFFYLLNLCHSYSSSSSSFFCCVLKASHPLRQSFMWFLDVLPNTCLWYTPLCPCSIRQQQF
jgi:hypothetical protein